MVRQLCWHEIRRRRKSEGGQKFLPPNPLPFCPPECQVSVLPREARQSEFAILIFVKKSSDFNQKAPPIFTSSKFDRNIGLCYYIQLNLFFLAYS